MMPNENENTIFITKIRVKNDNAVIPVAPKSTTSISSLDTPLSPAIGLHMIPRGMREAVA